MKDNDKQYESQLREKIRIEKKMRMGYSYEQAIKKDVQPEKMEIQLYGIDRLKLILETMELLSPNQRREAQIMIQTLQKYLTNIINNPLQPKYRKIKLANQTFCNKIKHCQYSQEIMEIIGFQFNQQCAYMETCDLDQLNDLMFLLSRSKQRM